MQTQTVPQYSPYGYFPQRARYQPDRLGSSQVLKNSRPNQLQHLQTMELQFESRIFLQKEIGDQGKIFEFSLTSMRLKISTGDTGGDSSAVQSGPQTIFDEDGYWGVSQTAARIAQFVLTGAGDDIDKLRQGREGILRGFKEAEEIWGGQLPDISYATIENAVQQIDSKIHELGVPVIDIAT